MITSPHNARLKWLRQLQAQGRARQEAQAFVIEGVRLAEEALQAGWSAQWVLYTADLSGRGQEVVQGFAGQGAEISEVSPRLLEKVAETETPQGLLVVLNWRPLPLPRQIDFLFIPDGIRDPGNLGTMLRTAAAAGVQAVLLPPGTTDAFAPKVLRAGMGAHFRLPIQPASWEQIEAACRNLRVFAAAAHGGLPYAQADFRPPLALIVGSEAEGVSPAALKLMQQQVHIPMPGQAESLNAAVAAGILLFEVARQRLGTTTADLPPS